MSDEFIAYHLRKMRELFQTKEWEEVNRILGQAFHYRPPEGAFGVMRLDGVQSLSPLEYLATQAASGNPLTFEFDEWPQEVE